MPSRLSKRGFGPLVLTTALFVTSCTNGTSSVDPDNIEFPDQTTTTTSTTATAVVTAPTTEPPAVIPTGGVVTVGVWGETDPGAATLTGAMIRSLTQPQLFTPAPDGTWEASLVESGSDRDGSELRSATFRLREGVTWSDGSRITGGDLWASADRTFVEEINVADDGLYTVRFNQPLVNWRRLWSGDSVVMPPDDGLYGGPWQIQSFDPDLNAILVPNEAWWGDGPYLDELRLLVVPDYGVMVNLFEDGVIDVVAPNAVTGRLQILSDLAPTRVATAVGGGWWVGLTADPRDIDLQNRLALLSAIDPEFFVAALMKGEAISVPSLGGTLVDHPASALSGIDETITITAPDDVVMLSAVERAVLLAVRAAGGVVPELREGTSDLAEGWINSGDAEAHVAIHYDGPGGPCWTCRFAHVDEEAARIADAGGAPLDELLATEGVLRVMWRPIQAVAWAKNLNGIVANGWALTPAWNAHQWWLTAS